MEAVLSLMVGGDVDDFLVARPVLEAMGSTMVHCGPHGAGRDRESRQPDDRRRQPPGLRKSWASTRIRHWRC